MTYLQIVNHVLRRLREDEVSSVSQTAYSTMVGDFVNDAKAQIEEAWDWNTLRSTVTVTTAQGTTEYALTGSGQKSRTIDAWNDTDDKMMSKVPQRWMDRMKYGTTIPQGSPYRYCYRGEDASDDLQIEVYPTPDGVYSLKYNLVIPQAELSADGTELAIPWRPVVLLTVAMLAEEKGETGSTTSARWFEMADKALDDAIAYDAGKHPDEFVWYGV